MKNKQERRAFLKTLGWGTLATAAVASSIGSTVKTKASDPVSEKYSLKNIEFEFLFDSDIFLGIGAITINGVKIRSGRLPFFAHVISPEAVELVNFKIKNKVVSDDAIIVDFTAQLKNGDNMDWMLHTVRNRKNISDWVEVFHEQPDLTFQLIIKPVTREFESLKAYGFSYQYVYKNASMPIYKITDRGSWELDGSATGNEFWMRNGVVDSLPLFSKKSDFYSTEWYLPGVANPNVFQFHPLQTALQGFTLTSSDKGNLITWATKVSHIRSLFEKWRNKNEIVHIHEHCNDLMPEFTTVPMEVLYVPEVLSRVERANLYNNVRELVHESLHHEIGMRRERITTYGIIEEWTEPDLTRYTQVALPKLLNAGVRNIFITNLCQNVMNTWGLENLCCNVDYIISDTVGEDKLKAFCSNARLGNARVEMWGNTALSTLTELFSHREGKPKGIKFLPYKGSIMEVIDKAESPWVRNPSNAIEADHYTPRFCALNLRDKDIRAYWMKQWKHFHDDLGISGIFLDSSFNMSSDKFTFRQWPMKKGWDGVTLDQKKSGSIYRPEKEPSKLIHTQYFAHLEWVVEMQKMGYYYCAEDLGVFGINRTGPEVVDRMNNLFIWADSYCDFNEKAVKRAGQVPIDVFFKGLAYRLMWKLYWLVDRDELKLGIKDPYAFKLLKIFNEVADFMVNREILPEEKAVVYHKDDVQIVWALADFEMKLKGNATILNHTDNTTTNNTVLNAKMNTVYQLKYA